MTKRKLPSHIEHIPEGGVESSTKPWERVVGAVMTLGALAATVHFLQTTAEGFDEEERNRVVASTVVTSNGTAPLPNLCKIFEESENKLGLFRSLDKSSCINAVKPISEAPDGTKFGCSMNGLGKVACLPLTSFDVHIAEMTVFKDN